MSKILEENERRNALLDEPYDPVTGIGSPIDRVPIDVYGETIYVPDILVPLLDETLVSDGAEKVAKRGGYSKDEMLLSLHQIRLAHDFEYWCAVEAYIKLDAETRSKLNVAESPLVLNRAQRIYWKKVYESIRAKEPIRIVLLKARQWGGTTATQAIVSWIQKHHRKAWNAFVCTISIGQAKHIRGMYSTFSRHDPQLALAPYEDTRNVKIGTHHGGLVGVTSIERPDSARSFSIHMAHLSEVGLWKSTTVVNAEDYAQAIIGAVPKEPATMIVMESTAKGVGNYFHRLWQAATEGSSTYKPIFIPWCEIPKYRDFVVDPEAFHASLTGYELALWTDHGCSLEQIAWYIDKLSEFRDDRTRMGSEFPTTAEEAFASTGSPYFTRTSVLRLRKGVRPPVRQGELRGEKATGPEALKGLNFRDHANGPLSIWRAPDEPVLVNDAPVLESDLLYQDRFVAFADFGGKTDRADWNVCSVADRARTVKGGPLEFVARLRLHCRPDEFAWLSAQLCAWYSNALLAYEINLHREDRGDVIRGFEPEWSLAAIREVMHIYPNLYFRSTNYTRADEPVSLEVGFHTNRNTKPMIMNLMDKALDEELFVEPDDRAINEMLTYEKKMDGTLGAVDGANDDIVISMAGCLWLAYDYLDPLVGRKPLSIRTRRPTAAMI